jgi:DNA mismatch repair ATPase MutS
MITGANEGGKSTFLRSVGLAQLMLQAGMLTPARALRRTSAAASSPASSAKKTRR